ncbi:MAG: hypothetical protein V4677_02235 [Bacteroidota bacterium]
MRSLNIKTAALLGAIAITMAACPKKKDNTTPDETTPVTPEAPCFNSNNNGTYTAGIGSIQSGSTVTSFTGGVVSITRTACHEVILNLTSNAGNRSETVTNVTLNSSNGVYDGSVSTGSITMSFGSHINAQAPGSFTIIAHK